MTDLITKVKNSAISLTPQQIQLKKKLVPWPDGPAGWSVIPTPKGCRFNPRSGHIPGLQVWSQVEVCTGGNWSMFLSYIDVSVSPFLPLSKKKNPWTYSQVRIKNINKLVSWTTELKKLSELHFPTGQPQLPALLSSRNGGCSNSWCVTNVKCVPDFENLVRPLLLISLKYLLKILIRCWNNILDTLGV